MDEGNNDVQELESSNLGNLDSKSEKKKGNFFFDWIVPIIVAVVIALFIKNFLFFKVYIPSGSMIPTLNEGDQLFVSKVYNTDKLERGDIIVFDSKELDDVLIKRLIGLPGDKIKITNGTVYVNGEKLQEDYVKNNDNFSGEFEVPEGKFFFLGDNRSNSYDSRRWQDPYIDASCIKAKAGLKVYPFSDFGFVS
ncbi:MAG: signal peptidase I [Clostridium sp.]|nr:signal peptidase I [Clostridium sp.]